MNTSEYVVRLRAEVSSFKQNMESARQSMKKVEQQGEALKGGVKSSFDSVTQSTKQFRAEYEKTQKTVSSSSGVMTTALKSLGTAVIAAFSVKAIVNFASESINCAAKLNAMTAMSNKAFGSMASDVQQWAKTASTSYGLSQRMALQYTSTLGSMAQGFGISQSKAVELSETIAARVGDLASYYSITQDEAYSKMTAIFTGETEALKSLGIVMTQTALDQFALANGFGKTTSQMSEQEKVMLRYKFIMDQTKLAEGDFMESTERGSWGNQIRRLKLQIEDFKTSVGQGLIVILTPVMKLLNTLMSKIVTVGNAFADLMAKISGTGQKSVSSVVSAISSVGEAAADATDTAEEAAEGVTQKTKEASKTILSFDQLHTLNDDKAEDNTSTKSDTTGGEAIKTEFQDAGKEAKTLTSGFDKIIAKAKELKKIFDKGFAAGLGDVNPEPVVENLKRIGDSATKIFTNPNLQNAAGRFAEKWSYSLGQQAGALASIGITIATAITGGIADYLSKSTERITDFLISMFDIGGRIAEVAGNFSQAVAEIFSVFADENGIQAISNFIGIFADAFMGITELAGKFVADIQSLFLQPIIDNVEGIKVYLDGILGFVASILGTLKDSVDATVGKALEVYDQHIHPFIESVQKGISELLGTFLSVWNEHFKPVMDKLAEKFDTVYKEHIQPMIDNVLELFGQLADTLKAFWENILQPFVKWFLENIYPALAPVIEAVGSVALDIIGGIGDAVSGIITTLKDVLKFLEDVFKGDWEAAWNDVSKIFTDIFSGIQHVIAGIINGILSAVEGLANGVVDGLNIVIGAMNNLSFQIPDWVPVMGGNTFGFNVPLMNRVSLPRVAEYANGGFPEDGFFLANHNELVGGFENGRTAVANNSQIEQGISIAVADAVVPVLLDILGAVKANKSAGESTIEIDGERLARIVTRNQRTIALRESAF